MPVVGFLISRLASSIRGICAASAQGLRNSALSKARTSRSNTAGPTVEFDRLPALAAELVRRNVAVIVATGGRRRRWRPRQATSTIPIVFASASTRSARARRQPQPAGRQRHRRELFHVECWRQSGLICCSELMPRRRALPCSSIRQSDYRRQICDDVAGGSSHAACDSSAQRPAAREIDAPLQRLRSSGPTALCRRPERVLRHPARRIVALAARHALPAIYVRATTSRPAA